MQPIDRDTQIKLMKDSDVRLTTLVADYLRVPQIAEAARRCAFSENASPEFTTKRVRIVRTG